MVHIKMGEGILRLRDGNCKLYCVYSGDRLYIYTHRVDGGLLDTYGYIR